jgi:succinate-semialdehyde dehydrogenase / glutarate-semialdehyde dehydrogenase
VRCRWRWWSSAVAHTRHDSRYRRVRRAFPVEDPATSEVIAEVADANAEDALESLATTAATFDEFRWTRPRERAAVLLRAYELLTARSDHVARLVTAEM